MLMEGVRYRYEFKLADNYAAIPPPKWEFFTFADLDGMSPKAQLMMIEMNLLGRKIEGEE